MLDKQVTVNARFLLLWGGFWLSVAVILPAVSASTCPVIGAQAATVTEVYSNGSTRTLVGRVTGWKYDQHGVMLLTYRSDGIAVAGFDQ